MKEHQHIEWKETWRDEYLRWICGFANAAGGVLVIGRNSRGEITGAANAAKLLEEIPNKVRDILGIMVEVNLRTEDGRDYLEIVVEPYPYPVSYKGEYHYRSGSTKQELKGAALDRFLLRKQGRTWDGVPVPHVTARDLSSPAIAGFRKRARQSRRLDASVLRESAQGLLEKLHLYDGKHLKRAAVLLFHPDPERFVTGAHVKIGYFRSESELLYHDEVHGDLFRQSQQAMELLLTKYSKAAISYRGIQRIETLPVPEAALREAVLNAIIHKDYASGSPIQIRVYADRLQIWNTGELPADWTVANLLGAHSSRPFNPSVANAFFRAGEIEAWGRGMRRIFDACREAGVPEPQIRYQPGDFCFEFTFSRQYRAAIAAGDSSVETSVEMSGKMSGKSREISKEKSKEKNSDRVLALLRQNTTATILEMAAALQLSQAGVEKIVRNLKHRGRLRRVGPDKGGHWEVL